MKTISCLGASIVFFSISCLQLSNSAQITPDTTLGADASFVTPDVLLDSQTVDLIQGGVVKDNNLLHSFIKFNVAAGKNVYFENPVATQAIFSRVTGDNASEIFGTLGVNGNANLFLFNPNGIIFGVDANLDISGSFLATTATEIEQIDGELLNIVSANVNDLLSINPNTLFQNALRNYQGQIRSDSNLIVGERLHFSANGSLEIKGDVRATKSISLLTTNGNIITANLDSSLSDSISGDGGDIRISTDIGDIATKNIKSFSFNESESSSSLTGNGGNISLLTTIGDISTEDIQSYAFAASKPSFSSAGHGGDIRIATTTGNISTGKIESFSFSLSEAEDSSVSGDGGEISISTDIGDVLTSEIRSFSLSEAEGSSVSGNGGEISISTNTGDIVTEKTEVNSIESFSFSTSKSSFSSAGNGGHINFATSIGGISTIDLKSFSFAFSESSSSSAKNGGDISFFATIGDIKIDEIESFSTSNSKLSSSAGDGGDISLLTTIGDIQTANIKSFSITDSGDSSVSGDGGIIIMSTDTGNILTKELSSISIAASNVNSSSLSGDAGDIKISINLGDIITDEILSFSSSSLAESSISGNGGNVNLSTINGNILIKDIQSFSLSDSKSGNGADITLLVTEEGNISTKNDAIFFSGSVARSGSSGNSGSVFLQTQNNISNLEISTLSPDSQSGVVEIIGNEYLELNNVDIITRPTLAITNPLDLNNPLVIDLSTVGQSGDIFLTSSEDLILNNSSVLSETNGSKPAGNVFVRSPGIITLNQSSITSDTNNTGKAGSIQFDSSILNVFNDSQIFARTSDSGDGGTVTVNASQAVNLGQESQDSSPILSVETSSLGRAGDIIINTPLLNVFDGARITAISTETSTNQDGGGSITLNADQMNLRGQVGIFAETQGEAPAGRLLLQPYQNNPNLLIALFTGSKISASTSGSGKGGDLVIVATNQVNINGAGILSVETTSSGDAGTIDISSKNLIIRDGVTLTASTSGSGDGGFIKFTVADDINILDSSVEAITKSGSTGKGGSIDIDPRNVNFTNSNIAVNSQGQGVGGDILLVADFLRLDNSDLTTETFSSDGGNVNLDIGRFFSLANGSNVTATAGRERLAGNGGNITIFSPIITAPLDQDNNIRAEAFAGTGGNIFIRTIGLSGLDFTGTDIPIRNDITASSGVVGLDGTVTIDEQQTESDDLPEDLIDADSLIEQNVCAIENDQIAGGSSLTIEGKGGLPMSLEGNASIRTPILSYLTSSGNIQDMISKDFPTHTTSLSKIRPIMIEEISLARGWQRFSDGKMELVSDIFLPSIQNISSHPDCLTTR
ncbi:filamentous hemagglutinin family outer membrane protein [[Leptolyngbya] sp. PCC 7376]|uniref:two-partner secretion domain-containing protein n=1 Tax=[Leptolyngbya] sp. PCC 7376 TaxID=111781 RepID=UPI00029F33F6|nr:filamentous hemagglutinin N-terminal domain-containing protein [[Leptolyngbya] sp. PCC 7376]AFY40202.1 filamentous hemagglutinin family outer membrane protein [[Leptolyngbya] sp. PCC 7376]